MKLVITLALAGALLLPAPAAAADTRPNIVVVMLDDVAADAVPGLLERLPQMRSVWGRGLRFTDHYGNDPLCCPGRATFLTGLYDHHHGVIENDGTRFDPSRTIATKLDSAGYHTAIAGKYLNGLADIPDKTPPGWDQLAIIASGYRDYDLWRDGVLEHHGSDAADYSTDVAAEAAVGFIASAPAAAPLFLMLTPYGPHRGPAGDVWQPDPADRHLTDARCDGLGKRRTPAWNDVTGKPSFIQAFPELPGDGWPLGPTCRTLLSVDEMVGRVKAALTKSGRWSDTVMILTADNGMSWGDHRERMKKVPWSTPLPLYVRWDAAVGSAPRTRAAMTQMADMAPTLCEIGGCNIPGDGRSIVPEIMGATSGRDIFAERPTGDPAFPPWRSLRTAEGWHYVEWQGGERDLYDMTADPWELDDLAGRSRYRRTLDDLAARLDAAAD